MRSAAKMILIKQDRIQWQPFFMKRGGDYAEWKLMPGYTPDGTGKVHFRRPKTPCLFRRETSKRTFERRN